MTIALPGALLQLERAALDAQAAAASLTPPEGAWAAWRKATAVVQTARQ
ncbi:MAG TPA: hypothetical protein VN520_17265 [Streptomyces sp.]|nr:hypothetical protein [Streptomyces sp.]HWU08106.1 hypothetical protein [Streptomyces sp.]